MNYLAIACEIGSESAGVQLVQSLGVDLALPIFGVPVAGSGGVKTHWILYTDVSDQVVQSFGGAHVPSELIAQCAAGLTIDAFLSSVGLEMM